MHDVWRVEQGLPQNTVDALLQTRDGYLWLGTEEGLVRFDGVRFTVFDTANTPGLLSNSILTLVEDRRKRLWIGTQNGLSVMENGAVRPFSTESPPAGVRINAMLEARDGTLWLGTPQGLVRIADGRHRVYTARDGLSQDRARALLEDRDGTLWVGTGSKGIDLLRDGRFTHLALDPALSSERITCLYQDRSGAVWVCTYGGGLNRVVDGKATRVSVEEGLSSNRIFQVREDREGSLWVATAQASLDRIQGNRVSSFGVRDGPSGATVEALLEDREGSLWFGSNGGGLHRLRDGKLTPFGTYEGLASDTVFPIFEDHEGRVWIGTRKDGLDRLETDGRVSRFTKSEGLPSDEITSLGADSEGVVWAGTRAGVARFDGGRFTALPVPEAGDFSYVNQIYARRDGSLLIGFGSRLMRFQDGRFTPFLHEQWPLPIGEIAEDRRGSLWIGSFGRGLFRLENGSATRYTVEQGLSSDSVSAVREDREGRLWIGTGGAGLMRLAGGRLARITTKSGLPSDTIGSILEDDRGNLWMGSFKGIVRVRKQDLDDVADGRARAVSSTLYGIADGMRSPDCSTGLQPAALRGKDGRLWFGTAGGAVVVDPENLRPNTLPPPVLVEDVLVDDERVKRHAAASAIAVPPGAGKLELRYTALSFRVPQRVRFKYRLEGFDKDWVDAGTERVARYTNLPPRSYTFRVRACNDDGVWNEEGAALAVRLLPLFHQTWWFLTLCAAAVVASGYGVHRARVRRLSAAKRELEESVAERTSELREKTRALMDAEERIARLVESSAQAVGNVSSWSKAAAREIAAAIGARDIAAFEVDEESVAPLYESGPLATPTAADLRAVVATVGQAFVQSGDATIVPVTGRTGELCGALVVAGRDARMGETECRLLSSFAHELGGAIEMRRMRRRLEAAEEKRAATRREMQERGVATLQTCPACGRCYDHTAARCEDDGASLESPRPLPYVLLDRYRFLRVLGRGGMGLVLAARDERLAREVAIKLLRPDHFDDAEFRSRFAREARALARIQHPGVIALHDSGELPDGTMYLVMEKLSGRDLGRVLKIHGPGTPRQVASLVRQGSSALGAAHRAGIVHRDIKPENVFLVGEGDGFRLKLLDFGVAKPLVGESGVTRTGMVIGTPAYMPPEQVHGEEVDTRADVYSFAAVCYEALAGRPAIPGADLGRVLVNVVNAEPPRLSTVLDGVPRVVDEAFASALAKDRARRLSDIELWAASFVDALETMENGGGAAGWPIADSASWTSGASERAAPESVGISRLGPDRWRAVSPYLDRALSLPAEDRAALIRSLKRREPAVAADLEALLAEEPGLAGDRFLERP